MKKTLIVAFLAAVLPALAQQSPKPSTKNLEARIDLESAPGPYIVDSACVENMVSACVKMHIANGLDTDVLKPQQTSLVEMLKAADQLTFERSHCSAGLYLTHGASLQGLSEIPSLKLEKVTGHRGAPMRMPETYGYELNGKNLVEPKCVALGEWSYPSSGLPYRYELLRARLEPTCRPLVNTNLSALRCVVPMPGAEVVKALRDSISKVEGTKTPPAPAIGEALAPANPGK